MTNMKTFFATAGAVLYCALWSTSIFAGGYQNGYITRVYAGHELGASIVFRVDSSGGVQRGNIPACSIYNDEWALDLTTDAGRLAYSVVQSAVQSQDTGRSYRYVQVYGRGTCDVTGDREDVRFLYSCYPPLCAP
jgi:hypothetical protein